MLASLFCNATEQRLRIPWRLGLLFSVIGLVMSHAGKGGWIPLFTAGTLLCGVVLLAARLLDRRPWYELGLRGGAKAWQDMGLGLMLGSAVMGLVALTAITMEWIPAEALLDSLKTPQPQVTGMILALTAMAFFEELFFRAYLIKNLAESYCSRGHHHSAIWWAGITSAACFAAVHPITKQAGALWLLVYLAGGLYLAAAYIFTWRIWLPLGFHLSWNISQILVFGAGLRPNGWQPTYSPEASTGCAMVALLGLAAAALLTRLWLMDDSGMPRVRKRIAYYRTPRSKRFCTRRANWPAKGERPQTSSAGGR